MINKIVKFDVKPEYIESFKTALLNDKENTKKELGCVEFRVYVDNKNPSLFFTYERFIDQAAFENHLNQDYVKELEKLIPVVLSTPVKFLSLGETNPLPIALKEANKEDDEFVIFFEFKFKDGYKDKLIQRFGKHIPETRKEKGNLLFDLFTIEGQDDTLMVYEHWRKESDVWDIHFKQPYAEITGALMNESVVGNLEQYMNFVTEIK
ncbi:putative quinol monooxygenase [Poseidonibacter antarcticus]|uniref:putative quinol monooxygenase n=1 Tax=Poseidonibacter antarcticus TaxID=2478538 RepID=UPI000EF47C30|nr:antibiotic biosynthesis monooxygenase [Poseidonibacter antarcticus]